MFINAQHLWILQMAGHLSDRVHKLVKRWSGIDRATVAEQLVAAADSVGANIAEGCGRQHPKDALLFFYFSRGSLAETLYWLERARARSVPNTEDISKLIHLYHRLAISLNKFITYRRRIALSKNKIQHSKKITAAQNPPAVE